MTRTRKHVVLPTMRPWRVLGRYLRFAATGKPDICDKIVNAPYPDSALRQAEQRLGGLIIWVKGPYTAPMPPMENRV